MCATEGSRHGCGLHLGHLVDMSWLERGQTSIVLKPIEGLVAATGSVLGCSGVCLSCLNMQSRQDIAPPVEER